MTGTTSGALPDMARPGKARFEHIQSAYWGLAAVPVRWWPRTLLCRFLGRQDAGPLGSAQRLASEKRQGTKSREVMHRWCNIGTDKLLTTDKWAAGPTAVGLVQSGPWTYGALANHLWSFAGDDPRSDVKATSVQPFVSYTTPDAFTFTLQSESTYDWEAEEWQVPVNFIVSKLTTIGRQPVSFGIGVKYNVESSALYHNVPISKLVTGA